MLGRSQVVFDVALTTPAPTAGIEHKYTVLANFTALQILSWAIYFISILFNISVHYLFLTLVSSFNAGVSGS
jgi:hypothetical protein